MVTATRTRLLIWDWNGTLLDDTQFCYGIANRMRVERGMPPLEGVDAYRRVFRFPIIDYYRAMGYTFETESYDDVSVAFHRLYEQGVACCPLTPGARETLLAVRARGVEQILLSVTAQRRLEREAALKGVADCFSELLGQRDDLGAGKAEMARQVIAGSGLSPQQATYILPSSAPMRISPSGMSGPGRKTNLSPALNLPSAARIRSRMSPPLEPSSLAETSASPERIYTWSIRYGLPSDR